MAAVLWYEARTASSHFRRGEILVSPSRMPPKRVLMARRGRPADTRSACHRLGRRSYLHWKWLGDGCSDVAVVLTRGRTSWGRALEGEGAKEGGLAPCRSGRVLWGHCKAAASMSMRLRALPSPGGGTIGTCCWPGRRPA